MDIALQNLKFQKILQICVRSFANFDPVPGKQLEIKD